MKKKIKPVLVTVIASTSLFIGGCSDNNKQAKVCADTNGWRVNDEQCEDRKTTGGTGGHWATGHYMFIPIGRGFSTPRVGERIVGGSTTPIAGRSIVSRGGFGATAYKSSTHS